LPFLTEQSKRNILGLNARRIFNMDVSERFPNAGNAKDGLVDTWKQDVAPVGS
jgi:hypothetical protein